MVDPLRKDERSALMAGIRSAGNRSTELRLIAMLRAHHITGWRRGSTLLGRPDFVFPKQRIALFVDGCFWHGCPSHYRRPQGSRAYWDNKIARNRARDRRITRALRASGWKVLRLWEHDLTRTKESRTIQRILRACQIVRSGAS